MKIRFFIFVAVLGLFVSACAPKDVTGDIGAYKPEWLWKPSVDGHVGGVGIAKEHVSGLDAQRRLAVSRAIDAIAVQLGVNVSNVTTIESIGDSSGASNVLINSYSIHSADGANVRATVREFWSDPYTKELYVWLVVE